MALVNEPVAIAISGGADSTFLAIEISKKYPNHNHHLMYVNHQLRPSENDNEIEHVHALAESLNMTAHILPVKQRKITKTVIEMVD